MSGLADGMESILYFKFVCKHSGLIDITNHGFYCLQANQNTSKSKGVINDAKVALIRIV